MDTIMMMIIILLLLIKFNKGVSNKVGSPPEAIDKGEVNKVVQLFWGGNFLGLDGYCNHFLFLISYSYSFLIEFFFIS